MRVTLPALGAGNVTRIVSSARNARSPAVRPGSEDCSGDASAHLPHCRLTVPLRPPLVLHDAVAEPS